MSPQQSAARSGPQTGPGHARGDRALLHLARLKLRGSVRRHLKRMRQPKGLLLTLFGVALFGLWLLPVLLRYDRGGWRANTPLVPEILAGVAVSGLLLVAFVSGLGHPGVFVPPAEVERLLSAPVTRGALLRHRVYVAFGRALPGLAIFGLLFARGLESPAAAILGLTLASAAVALAQQLGSITAICFQARPWLRAGGWVIGGLTIGAVVALFRDLSAQGKPSDWLGLLEDHAVFQTLNAPGAPFAHVAFAPHFALALMPALWVSLALVGLMAALCTAPVDVREATLRTAAKVDERLTRLRRGVFMGTRRRTDDARPMWRAPWWAGRGPAGAVVWSKTTGLLRRSPWTFVVAGVMLALVVAFSLVAAAGPRDSALLSALLIAIPGALYLCGTLRIDLREEVDRLELWKALPVSRRRLFVALVTPQWVAVTVLLVVAVLVRTSFADSQHAEALVVAGLLPLGLFVWIALDNALFLVWPVRPMPGPGGSMQHVARATLFFLLRGGAALVAAGLAALAYYGAKELSGFQLAGFVAAALVLAVASLVALELGGRALHAYDPAQDAPE